MRAEGLAVGILSAALLGGCYFDFSAEEDASIDDPDASVNRPDAAPAIDAPVADPDAPDNTPDAGPPDADLPDATPPADAFEPIVVDYTLLSETGLYTDITTKTLAADIYEFEPRFKLWSDDAHKTRWIQLPPGTQIDTTDMDHWVFPVGTKIWKEFTHVDGNGTIRLETRLIVRTGPNRNHYWMGTFAWNADETEATFRRFGEENVRGTDHDLPAADQCPRCHLGEDSSFLGFSALQLSHGGTNDIDYFDGLGLFTTSPAAGGYDVPGTAVEKAALGYLHANCAHCHNPHQGLSCNTLTGLSTRLYVTDTNVTATDTYTTAVDQMLQYWTTPARGNEDGFTYRIVPGDVANSGLHWRISHRNPGIDPPNEHYQMPPLATEFVDPDGVAAIEAWINSL
jgi:hypothetical protein